MRPLLLTLGTRAVTFVPRLALQAAGTAWGIGEGLLGKVLGTAPPKAVAQQLGRPEPVRAAEEPPQTPVPLAPPVVEVPAPEHDDLPLEDYDHLTVGELRSRLRQYGLDDLRRLQAYETSHANRLPVQTLLANRVAKLEDEQRSPAPAPS